MTAGHETRYRVLLVFVHLLGLFIIYRLGADVLADIACGSGNSVALKMASSADPGDAAVVYDLALKSHYSLTKPDLDRAIGLYRRAVGRDPFYAPAWYQMALACRLAGRDREAGEAIKRYEFLGRSYAADLWNIGVFRLGAGEADRAAACFKRCIELDPESERGISGLYLLMNTPQSYIAEKVLPRTKRAFSGHLDYLLGSGRADDALSFFRLAGSAGIGKEPITRAVSACLCRQLIAEGRYDEAWDFWRAVLGGVKYADAGGTGDGKTIIVNGGFEEPIAESREACFGWMARRQPGLEFSYGGNTGRHGRHEGGRGIHIRFDGRSGLGLQLSQYVRAAPNRSYELKADIRTENIITASGIYLEVRSRACGGYYARSEALRGTGDWRVLSLVFKIPPGCRIFRAGIARDAALELDPRAQSDIWIDNVSISAFPQKKSRR